MVSSSDLFGGERRHVDAARSQRRAWRGSKTRSDGVSLGKQWDSRRRAREIGGDWGRRWRVKEGWLGWGTGGSRS
ncbi:hypothetical protein Acr_16g0004290 [Actinidia rufa]|uniref:Uncharacterized protein n=1 Tax=Actinidia rufa TaxID=165716 RepID=A0A7J0FYM6_9ERIC|nr:hypothetical protein Acr_16g0004290 [Actinidia rufa]